MSKCVKCGHEILTGDIHWEMGLCNKCYNELYKDRKTHISLDKMWLNIAQRFRDENEKLQDKVADLEAKLAESEKNYKDARELGIEQFHSLKEIINSSQEEIDKLKQQLAEKDKEIKQLKQSQKQLAIEKLTMFEAMLSRAVQWDNDSKCWTISEEVFGNFIVQIDEKIEELKGEETI